MTDDIKPETLKLMIQAQSQVLETIGGIVLGNLDMKSSQAIKTDLKRNAEKYVSGYTGGPIDALYLQKTADLLQSEVNRITERMEVVEKSVRQQRGQLPSH